MEIPEVILRRCAEILQDEEWKTSLLPFPKSWSLGDMVVLDRFDRIFVVISSDDDGSIEVAATSPETSPACSWDLVVPYTENDLRVRYMVEVWNRRERVPARDIKTYLGKLSRPWQKALGELYIESLQKGQGRREAFCHLVGTEMTDLDDDRREFQRMEFDRVHPEVSR